MKALWSLAAEQDRSHIIDFIAAENPLAAIHMDELFAGAAARFGEHPLMGRVGTIPGTREWIPHESYRLVYEVRRDSVWILALVHNARLWPPA